MKGIHGVGAAVLLLGFAPAAPAADAGDGATLEEVVVTAEKVSSSLQKTSVAIATVSGEDIAQQGVTQLDDALRNMVGVVVTQGPTGLDPVIRGVGPSVPANLGGPAGVSTYYDGVFTSANLFSRLGYYDLARVEVIRGPQGTLYGTNAEGGVVSTVSNNPTQEFEGSASLGVGNYSLVNMTGMLNLPLSSSLALRIAGGSVDRNGFLANGQDDNRALGLRAKLLYKPGEVFSLLLGVESAKVSGEGPGTVAAFAKAPSASDAYDNACTTTCAAGQFPSNQIYKRNGYKVWAEATGDVGIGQLTAIPAYQWLGNPQQLQYTGLTHADSDGTGGLIQRSVEVRLASKSSSRVKWQVGYLWYGTGQVAPDGGNIATAITGNLITDATGAVPGSVNLGVQKNTHYFAQATVPVFGALRLIGGISYSRDQATRVVGASSSESTWSSTDWKAGFEYDLAADSMLYLTAATGFRPGAFSPAPPFPAYGEEKLRSYELGVKNEFLAHRLRVNADVYYYDYSGYQVPNLVPCGAAPLPACLNPSSPFNLSILNLPVTVKGAELETTYLVTADDTLSLAAAYLKSEVTTSLVVRPPFPTGFQMEGQPLPSSPKFTFNAGYSHSFRFASGASLEPRLDLHYRGSTYVTIPPSPLSSQDAFWEQDLSIAYADAGGRWTLNGYVKNLSNEVVKSNYIGSQMTLESPRTYGFTVTAHF